MSLQRPALIIASTVGLLAMGVGFLSSAGAQGRHLEDAPRQLASAVFAGGCFWCVEADFDKLPGVVDTVAGYTGGTAEAPTYRQVTRGGTGHYEAVRVTYDPSRISYEELAAYFVRHIDPTDTAGQFCDKGESYRSAFFVSGAGEREVAERLLTEAAKTLNAPIATRIKPAATFWPAEDYHQDYYTKNPVKYGYYRKACGRDARLAELWGKPAAGH